MDENSAPMIDNAIYDTFADGWRDENNVLSLLGTSVNPWRVPFFSQVLTDQFGETLSNRRVLDVGTGGGLLAEELRQIDLRVTGFDLSQKSLAAAKAYGQNTVNQVDYHVGNAIHLPYPMKSFDIVVSADVLEHIHDWPSAIKEISRVLKPGGLFLFDTINRTLLSYLTLILGAQVFPFTRIFPPKTHNWKMFITPDELKNILEQNQLKMGAIRGSNQKGNIFSLLSSLLLLKTGKITFKDFGEMNPLLPAHNLNQNYLGFATKI